jgi:hypothetical protein
VVGVSRIYPPVKTTAPIPLTVLTDSIPAGGTKVINIQPPAGETWRVYICAHSYVLSNGSYVEIVAIGGNIMKREYGSTTNEPTVCVEAVLTADKYVFVRANNPSTTSAGIEVVYSGEKL